MNRNIRFLLTAAAVLLAFLAVPVLMAQDEKAQAETAQTPAEKETIAKIRKLMEEGNFKESADAARAALEAIPAKSQSEAIGTLWNMYRASLFSNNRVKEYDDAFAFVTARFPKNVSLAAELNANVTSYGFFFNNTFTRGSNRGNAGRRVNSTARDRVENLRFMASASEEAKNVSKPLQIKYYRALASLICRNQSGSQSYKLQALTDLTVLPDYDDGDFGSSSRPPVNKDGSPVLYSCPKDFASAKCDGERFRWALEQAIALGDYRSKYDWASFLSNEFDFSSINWDVRHEYQTSDKYRDYLYELKDNETIAELADGIRKIALPEEFSYIRILKELANDEKAGLYKQQAASSLGSLYLARMQYESAADWFKKAGENDMVQQILCNWGSTQGIQVVAYGTKPVLSYRSRNTTKVRAVVTKADPKKAVEIMLKSLREGGDRSYETDNAYMLNTGAKGWAPAIKEKISEFTFDVKPKPHHWETDTEVTLPITEPGAYIVRTLPEGTEGTYSANSWYENLVWITPEILTKESVTKGRFLTLNDSKTGEPLADRKLKIMNYRTEYSNNRNRNEFGGQRYRIIVKEFEVTTGKDGAVIFPERLNDRTLILSESEDGLTFLPHAYYSTINAGRFYERDRDYIITDRPVYRPGDTVKYTVYTRRASYDEKAPAKRADYKVKLTGTDARGKKLYEENISGDPMLAAATEEFVLPDDVALGSFHLSTGNGGVSFSVEEYKKPEYLLDVEMPETQVKTGGIFEAKIKAKYYFGAPMSGAKIKYTVHREQARRIFPFRGRFDWLFGEGYWICSTAYRDESIRQVTWGRDLITQAEGVADDDGCLTVPIDTGDALRRFGNLDFRYIIDAEVSDESNRVVNGSGSVVTAAQPFYVTASAKSGFARTGKPVTLVVKATTPDGKPVAGKGKVSIYLRDLDANGVPHRVGQPVKVMDVTAGDENGVSFVIDRQGVYEVVSSITSDASLKANDGKDPVTCEGSYPLFVAGFDKSGDLFSTLPLEITTDRSEYNPGESASILVSMKKPGATLYFFTRQERETQYECVRLGDKEFSHEFKMDFLPGDRPNTYVSVIAVGNGEVQRLSKMIAVPPISKMLDVDIAGPKKPVKPRQNVPMTITVKDGTGKPVSGAVTLTVYDKSLDAIASSRIPAINSFFWNWKRSFYSDATINLENGTSLHNNPARGIHFMNDNLSMNGRIIPFTLGHGESVYFDGGIVRKGGAMARGGAVGGGFGGGAVMSFGAAMNSMDDDAVMEAAPSAAPGGARMMMKAASADMAMAEEAVEMEMGGGFGGGGGDEGGSFVRSNFLDAAYFAGLVKLDENGQTTIDVPAPDNLTTWKVHVWSLTADTSVGEGDSEFVVSKDLIARLELPRFLVNGDTVNAVANIHNYTDKDVSAAVTLTVDGDTVNTLTLKNNATITVKAGGHTACPFTLNAKAVGESRITLSVKAGDEDDALQLALPVLVKGIDKQVNNFAYLDKDNKSAEITLKVPEQRKPETTFLTVNLAPGAAMAMVELLPYLAADGEATVFGVVNRFVPSMAAKNALSKLGVDFDTVHPAKTSRDKLYTEYMEKYCWKDGKVDPSFDAKTFNRVMDENLKMILTMVNSDGGWGWFSGYREYSYPDTTAYVVDALLDVSAYGNKTVDSHMNRGVAWLQAHVEERLADIRKYKSVSNTDALVARVLAKAGKRNKELNGFLYELRSQLAPYGLSMLGLALEPKSDERAMVVRNLTQFRMVDDENQTSYLNIPAGCRFFWYGSENETNAAYLDLLLDDDPSDPNARKLANYLVTNIRNSPWRNTNRELGAVVRTLARYIKSAGEDAPDMDVKVLLDGKEIKSFHVDKASMWDSPFVALANPDALGSGDHKLEISIDGPGVLYMNSMLNYFTLEDEIEPAGLEMKIKRNYYRLVPEVQEALAAGLQGSVQTLKRDKYKRVPLKSGDVIRPGELVEVEIISTAKNDYDYVCFADSMPAGFEFEKPVSGYDWTGRAPIYREYRERGAKFYLRNMARGDSNVFYRMRAQLPGRFIALPAGGSGVYAPELKCNSDQHIFVISE